MGNKKRRRPSVQSQYFGKILKLLYKKGFVNYIDVMNELGVSATTARELLKSFVKNDYVRKRLAEQNLKVVYRSAISLGFEKINEGSRMYAFLCWKDSGEPLIAPMYSAWRAEEAEKIKERYWREKKAVETLDRWFKLEEAFRIGSGGSSPRTPHLGENDEGVVGGGG